MRKDWKEIKHARGLILYFLFRFIPVAQHFMLIVAFSGINVQLSWSKKTMQRAMLLDFQNQVMRNWKVWRRSRRTSVQRYLAAWVWLQMLLVMTWNQKTSMCVHFGILPGPWKCLNLKLTHSRLRKSLKMKVVLEKSRNTICWFWKILIG